MEDNKKFELDDDQLDAVAGGASEEFDLNEERLPLGWYVTCCKCTFGYDPRK